MQYLQTKLLNELPHPLQLLIPGEGWRQPDLGRKPERLQHRQHGKKLIVLHHVRRYLLHVARGHLNRVSDPSRLPLAILPASASRNVDFPAPLGPRMAVTCPRRAWPEMSLSRYTSFLTLTPSFFCFLMTL